MSCEQTNYNTSKNKKRTRIFGLNKRGCSVFLFLIICILVVIIIVLGFQNRRLRQSLDILQGKATQAHKFKDNSKYRDWVVFQSTRVPFSFMHPPDYKLGVHPNELLYQFVERVEAINLGTFDAEPNAGGPAHGSIIVEKYDVLSDHGVSEEDRLLNPYRKKYKHFKEQKLKQGETNIPTEEDYLPKVRKIKVGNAEGYELIPSKYSERRNMASFTRRMFNRSIYVYRRGLLYIIRIHTDNAKEAQLIEDMLPTFNFQY